MEHNKARSIFFFLLRREVASYTVAASFWDTIRAATDNELLAVCRVGIYSARSATRNLSFCLELDRQATLAM